MFLFIHHILTVLRNLFRTLYVH